MKNVMKWIWCPAVLVALSACNGIPDEYQGVFANKEARLQLTLSSSDATIQRGSQKQEYTPKDLNFKNVSSGNPGIYVRRHNGDDPGLIDIFYLAPDKAAKKNESDFVWAPAEIMYVQIDSRKRTAVNQISLTQCKNGFLMLDWASNTYELGCPADAADIVLTRTKKKESFNPFGGLGNGF